MKRKNRKTHNYKFTEKKHSVRGIAALALALVSLGLGAAMCVVSARAKGAGSVYLGSMGVLSLLLALAAFVTAVLSLREDKSYRGFPVAATVVSGLTLGGWIALYVVGFLI